MILSTRHWGQRSDNAVVCIHGLTQHGGVFEGLAESLVECGFQVISVDLRGHGASAKEPPWNSESHVEDLFETLETLGVKKASWIGHSFGGRLAALAADRMPDRVERVLLLDPGLAVSPAQAYKWAEMDRLDWSFSSVEGAVNALLGSKLVVAAPKETVASYVKSDLRRGGDGRLRFSYCPSAVVTGWSEVALAPPPIAQIPTLLVRPVSSPVHVRSQDQRYRDELGSMLTIAVVPNGHNVLWEAATETAAAVLAFLREEAPNMSLGAESKG